LAISGTVTVATFGPDHFCSPSAVRDWIVQTVDLSAYAGQDVTLRFVVSQEAQPYPDAPGWETWALDDVGFKSVP
jgi:hypothetical protein